MMVIIIGENTVNYCRVRKKDLVKRFYTYRDQLYLIIPECFRQIEIRHNRAWTRTETAIIFDENNPIPYFCKHPEYYTMDSRLVAIDEFKLMHADKKHSWRGMFQGGENSPWRQVITGIPLIMVALIVLGGFIFGH